MFLRKLGWMFFLVYWATGMAISLGDPFAAPVADGTCGRASFATDLKDFQCLGLDNDGAAANAKTEEACIAECCRRGPTDCSIWQFSPEKDVGKDHELPGCWLGKNDIPCVKYKGWKGGMANIPKAVCPDNSGVGAKKGVDFTNKESAALAAKSDSECCHFCQLYRCQAWVYDSTRAGTECSLKKWADQAKPIKASNPAVSYGFGPGTDCVTVASHMCDSVGACQAFGIGTEANDGTVFDIELYSCLEGDSAPRWTVYRKQDKYSAPFSEQRGQQSACTAFIHPMTSFTCEMSPYAEGQKVTLAKCDAGVPSQKWRIDDIRNSFMSSRGPGMPEPEPTIDTLTLSHRLTNERAGSIDPGKCSLSGMWAQNNFKFEIRKSQYAQKNSFNMLALTPTDWLTATGTFTEQTGEYVPSPAPWVLSAVLDNGKRLEGLLSRTSCSSIHWGPPAQYMSNRKYLWGSPCNDTDVTQIGWSIQKLLDDDGSEYVVLKYSNTDVTSSYPKVFTGCIDRSGTNSGGESQAFVSVPRVHALVKYSCMIGNIRA
jgi:hypothetical protein